MVVVKKDKRYSGILNKDNNQPICNKRSSLMDFTITFSTLIIIVLISIIIGMIMGIQLVSSR